MTREGLNDPRPKQTMLYVVVSVRWRAFRMVKKRCRIFELLSALNWPLLFSSIFVEYDMRKAVMHWFSSTTTALVTAGSSEKGLCVEWCDAAMACSRNYVKGREYLNAAMACSRNYVKGREYLNAAMACSRNYVKGREYLNAAMACSRNYVKGREYLNAAMACSRNYVKGREYLNAAMVYSKNYVKGREYLSAAMACSRNYVKGREYLNDGITVNTCMLELRWWAKVVLSLWSGSCDTLTRGLNEVRRKIIAEH